MADSTLSLSQATKQVVDAYDEDSGTRNLTFYCDYPFDVTNAVKAMKLAIPDGYNEFSAELLNKLPEDSKIYLAREYSVCIYVQGVQLNNVIKRKMKADEFDFDKQKQAYRLWWD